MKDKNWLKDIIHKVIENDIDIVLKFLNKTNKKIFSDNDLGKILDKYNKFADFNIKRNLFINILLELEIISKIPIECPSRNINRYMFKSSNIYEKALSLNSNSYLSHYTAVFLHDLTLNVPKVIYTNTEQYEKPNKTKRDELRQINIDKAFSRKFRRSNNIAYFKKQPNDIKVVMLNSKYKKDSKLIYLPINDSLLAITSIERTLIDIVVRPEYSGGVSEVINIFKNSKSKISINKLISILNNSDYIYPYHQSVGFYLETAGYPENTLKKFENYDFKYNFYLAYQMIDPSFSKRWKVYYPNYINY
ncbi:MAG: hypothetical protein GX864_03420 [Mollicutes bacterium]|nr:hypothetical protein [Mollicutes bacterium]